MKIEAIPELALTAQDDAQIGALLDIAFADNSTGGFGGRSYYKQRHHLRIIMRDEGRIVGHIALLFRAIQVGAVHTQIVGLAEVATHPDLGGRGIATHLLKEAIAQSRQSLATFMVLFGDHPIYAKHGFETMPNMLRYVVMDSSKTATLTSEVRDGLMVLPLRDAQWDTSATVDLLGHLF